MPHPLEHKFVLKVQTEKPTKPTEALEGTVDQLISDLAILEDHIRVHYEAFTAHLISSHLISSHLISSQHNITSLNSVVLPSLFLG
jgi:hypothetical protein